MKTTTITPSIRQHVADIKQQQQRSICAMFGWNMDQYCEHQLEEYDNFLSNLFFGFPQVMLEEVKYSPIMAGFWKNEWMIRNAQDFLPFAKELLFEGHVVTEEGKLIFVKPSSTDYTAAYDEYLWVHSYRKLIHDDNFMAQYNRVLEMIRKEAKR